MKFLRTLIRSEHKSCSGKIKFPREDSAERSARAMEEKKRERGTEEIFEHYKCSYCDGWHIGHATNFDWIPSSHKNQYLMMNQYYCNNCNVEWITHMVFARKILFHFPVLERVSERFIVCKICKETNFIHKSRKWVRLEQMPVDSEITLQELVEPDYAAEKLDISWETEA